MAEVTEDADPAALAREAAALRMRRAHPARDGQMQAFPIEDSQHGRRPQAMCTHTAPPEFGAAVPAPQFSRFPDSGRPPVERPPRSVPAPAGRPDTTAPVKSARRVADADRGDRPPGLGEDYLDGGFPISGDLAGSFDELIDAGLLALADPDPHGLRRFTLTATGHARYAQLVRDTPRGAGLRVPDPQFPHPKTPTGRRSSSPAPHPTPGGQPDPRHQAGELRGCGDGGRSPQPLSHPAGCAPVDG